MKIVLASNNPGKAREIQAILGDLPIEILAQSTFEVPEIPETGLSFVENALIKARNAARHTGLAAIGEDSGLEVDALHGAPGIYSARYAGEGGDEANNRKLLAALEGVPDEQRTARFVSVIVYMTHAEDPTPVICQGTWEGRVLFAPRGEHGFGYDPLFYVPSHDCASAELPPQEKNRISHRAQSLRCLVDALQHRLDIQG